MEKDKIIVKGAKEHNLKNINVEIPRNKLVVITGLSGSGKSSLAFDTIYAEGQRRYIESLSTYARQFLGQLEKPQIDYIEGLSPTISIEQKNTFWNPRSTVGTVTEIYDYFRLLFANIGTIYCYKCGRQISQQTVQQMVDQLMELKEETKIEILAPIIRGRKGEYKETFREIQRQGFVRVKVDDKIYHIEDEIKLDKNKKHDIFVIIDRLIIKNEINKRLADSLEIALKMGEGTVFIEKGTKEQIIFSEKFACIYCGIGFEEISPRMFSFNSPYGACSQCGGLGCRIEIDPELVVPDDDKSINQGAIITLSKSNSVFYECMMKSLASYYNFSLDIPFKKLPSEIQQIILYGSKEEIPFTYKKSEYAPEINFMRQYEGIIPNLARRYKQTSSESARYEIEKYMRSRICSTCKGNRLKPESLAIKINNKSIMDICKLSILQTINFFADLVLTEREKIIAGEIIKEINKRLKFLIDVGLDYLTLERKADTLSGGEAERIKLATQIGSSLTGVIYILDEPSIGLHPRDNRQLIDTLKNLKNIGNTVLVVEHDETMIRESDYCIDLGPGAGVQGGYVVACGTPFQIMQNKNSLTGKYLRKELTIPIPKIRKKSDKFIEIIGASQFNLKNINVKFPIGTFTCVTGVSGSGKSTLIYEILYKIIANKFYHNKEKAGEYCKIYGLEYIDKLINVDHSPIGRTPRSNPATYTGVFTFIRELYSNLPEAKLRGYLIGRFSFNVKGGRCEACQGEGIIKIEMHFLPDVYIPCEVCKGKRYNRETLEVKYKNKNIFEILEMTVEEAMSFFSHIPLIKHHLETLYDVGLGYIKLGQSAPTLSGGEAQRVKLASELSKRSTGSSLYLLDEPTTGLHFADVQKLLNVLLRLRDRGNTIIVIEHNLDIIKSADYIIDLGPEGGDKGGEIVATGTPEEVSKNSHSYTGKYLKKILKLNQNIK